MQSKLNISQSKCTQDTFQAEYINQPVKYFNNFIGQNSINVLKNVCWGFICQPQLT